MMWLYKCIILIQVVMVSLYVYMCAVVLMFTILRSSKTDHFLSIYYFLLNQLFFLTSY